MNNFSEVNNFFSLFAQLGSLFKARFLLPTWNKFPKRETNDWDAVGIFLAGYAFERQGAKPDYHHVAADVVVELARRRITFKDEIVAKTAWELFCHLSGEENLNYANNPLCPKLTSYVRKTGSTNTYKSSIIEFLQLLLESGLTSNIVEFARNGLQLDRVKVVHTSLQDVNGIGSKISSLFLRDVAIMYDLTPTKDRYLLQPVDVWVRRVFEKLSGQKVKNEQDFEPVQRWILEKANNLGVHAEAVNSGMWYFSSQVADSYYRLSKSLDDYEYAKTLLHKYIESVNQEMIEASRWYKVTINKGRR